MAKEEADEEAERAVGLGQVSSRHITKRALRNKALAISFNDKDLKDFVGGFHKRKKKRRKEAQQKIREKDRLKRIEKRKQRKQERAYVQGSGSGAADGTEPEGDDHDHDQDEETEPKATVAATRKYNAGDLTIMVTTSEISREEEEKQRTPIVPRSSSGSEKKVNIPVKKKQFKAVPRRRSGPKAQKKREKRKGKVTKGRER